MSSQRYRLALVAAVAFTMLGSAGAARAQQAAQAPMPNMPGMDMRGGIRGTVRGATKAPVADTTVIAVNAVNGARFEAMTDGAGRFSTAISITVHRSAGGMTGAWARGRHRKGPAGRGHQRVNSAADGLEV